MPSLSLTSHARRTVEQLRQEPYVAIFVDWFLVRMIRRDFMIPLAKENNYAKIATYGEWLHVITCGHRPESIRLPDDLKFRGSEDRDEYRKETIAGRRYLAEVKQKREAKNRKDAAQNDLENAYDEQGMRKDRERGEREDR